MPYTVSQVGSNPESLLTASLDARAAAQRVNAQIEKAKGEFAQLNSDWTGTAADAAQKQGREMFEDQTAYRDKLYEVAKPLATGGKDLTEIRGSLKTAVDSAEDIWDVADNGSVTPGFWLSRLAAMSTVTAMTIESKRITVECDIKLKLAEEEKRIGDDPGEPGYDPVNEYEDALREAGLLDGPSDGFYREWLANAAKNDVPPEVLVDIARRHNITPQSFDVLKGMERVTDNDGKTYFILPSGVSAEDARDATLMTYVLNAGTGYEDSRGSGKNSFAETPYAADEVQRIIDRQESNSWSYVGAELFSGRLAATPNGMLMGLGGNMVEDQLSQLGGSTVGDVFLVNIDNPADPAQQLRDIIDSGQAWYSEQRPLPGSTIDLDRILHHEERHSQQWADLGYENMVEQYGQKMVEEWITKQRNPFETNAGASDGGYS